VATLLDTSALAVLIRRARPAPLEAVARAARAELESGRALVSVVTAAELLVGARDQAGARRLAELLEALPVVSVDRDVAICAGRMGAHCRARGAPIPVPDLMIAATAVTLDVPLLACDSDFRRGRDLADPDHGDPDDAVGADPDRPAHGEAGGALWGRLAIHPASVFSWPGQKTR
jgi:predicted nucleic acid-binding protein